MKPSATRLALVCALLCTVASSGQENAPSAPAPATRPPPAATPPPAGQQPDSAAPPPAAAQRPAVDDEFIPTEELAPDAAVTFPVDI